MAGVDVGCWMQHGRRADSVAFGHGTIQILADGEQWLPQIAAIAAIVARQGDRRAFAPDFPINGPRRRRRRSGSRPRSGRSTRPTGPAADPRPGLPAAGPDTARSPGGKPGSRPHVPARYARARPRLVGPSSLAAARPAAELRPVSRRSARSSARSKSRHVMATHSPP